MAKILPFQAYRYSSKAGPIADLVSQPYDKITPKMQQGYYEASPHNIVRLIKGKDEDSDNDSNNVYTRAAATLKDWITEGILEQEREPALYPYFQEFRHPETGEVFVRKGFIGLTQAVEYSEGIIHGHELTHSGPKMDRLKLTRHTKTHFGQLFMVYDDPDSAVDARLDEAASEAPLISVEDEFKVKHQVWRITDPAVIEKIQAVMESKKIMIADGHHRYETVLAYARENPDVPGADKVMMTLVNMRAPGLVVLATHRVLDGLSGFDSAAILNAAGEFFAVEKLSSLEELQDRLNQTPPQQPAIGAVLQGDPQTYLVTPKSEAIDGLTASLSEKERSLDVVILHKVLLGRVLGISEEDVKELKNIRYVRGLEAAADMVRSGDAEAAFLLRPVDVHQVADIAFSGGVMPQKSTDFYPKLLAGLTIYRFG